MMSLPSLSHARVAVVGDARQNRTLIQSLRRMGLAEVRTVASLADAVAMAAQHIVDACLVVMPRTVPDDAEIFLTETSAPGRRTGIPSLLLADVVTPYVERCARGNGYMAAVPLDLPTRLLYRRVRALFQRPRRQKARVRIIAGERGWPRMLADPEVGTDKPKLQ